jgi:predicted Rdx family selenoprotein
LFLLNESAPRGRESPPQCTKTARIGGPALREAAERELGVRAKIKTGSKGDFVVLVDGRNVFGYKKEGRLPENDELLRRITAVEGASTL